MSSKQQVTAKDGSSEADIQTRSLSAVSPLPEDKLKYGMPTAKEVDSEATMCTRSLSTATPPPEDKLKYRIPTEETDLLATNPNFRRALSTVSPPPEQETQSTTLAGNGSSTQHSRSSILGNAPTPRSNGYNCSSDQKTGFKIVNIYTAKCSVCDKRNSSPDMLRCSSCGWEICQKCQKNREKAGKPVVAHGRMGMALGSSIRAQKTIIGGPANGRVFRSHIDTTPIPIKSLGSTGGLEDGTENKGKKQLIVVLRGIHFPQKFTSFSTGKTVDIRARTTTGGLNSGLNSGSAAHMTASKKSAGSATTGSATNTKFRETTTTKSNTTTKKTSRNTTSKMNDMTGGAGGGDKRKRPSCNAKDKASVLDLDLDLDVELPGLSGEAEPLAKRSKSSNTVKDKSESSKVAAAPLKTASKSSLETSPKSAPKPATRRNARADSPEREVVDWAIEPRAENAREFFGEELMAMMSGYTSGGHLLGRQMPVAPIASGAPAGPPSTFIPLVPPNVARNFRPISNGDAFLARTHALLREDMEARGLIPKQDPSVRDYLLSEVRRCFTFTRLNEGLRGALFGAARLSLRRLRRAGIDVLDLKMENLEEEDRDEIDRLIHEDATVVLNI